MDDASVGGEVGKITPYVDESGRSHWRVETKIAGRFEVDTETVQTSIDDFLSSFPIPPEEKREAARNAYFNLFGISDVDTPFYLHDENGEFIRFLTLGEIIEKTTSVKPPDDVVFISCRVQLAEIMDAFDNVGVALGPGQEIYLDFGTQFGKLLTDKAKEQAGQITLAQFASKGVVVNHSFPMKVLAKGIVEIAYGQSTSFELAPKKGTKSGESYKMTAAEDACKNFIVDNGGNEQIFCKIVETVMALAHDEQAEKYTYGGRVWFTTSKILEEVLRTQGGTVEARHSVNKKLIDAALTAASGMQIVGTGPNGETIGILYVVNAEKKTSVSFGGNTYTDVWGIAVGGNTVHDRARKLKQVQKYPLLPTNKPLTIDQAAITRYLEDLLHEARGKLYTSKGAKAVRRKYTLKRSWPEVFGTFSPMVEMDSRQKKKLVSDFQLVLSELAEMDSKNELHEGRPLYINAHSERQAGKGSGRGAWVALVIECSTNFHRPKINLM